MFDYSFGKDANFITHYEINDGKIILYKSECVSSIPYTKENEKLVLNSMKEQVNEWKHKVDEYRRDYSITKKLCIFKITFFASVAGLGVILFKPELLPLGTGCIAIFPIYKHFTKNIKAYLKDYDKNLFFVKNEEDINKVISKYVHDYNLVDTSYLCLTINDIDNFTKEDLENIFNCNIDEDLKLKLRNSRNC